MHFPGIGEIDIENTDTQILARWWNALNDWKWPNDMPCRPYLFNKLPGYIHMDDPKRFVTLTKYMIMHDIIQAIKHKISGKECLRYHHINNLKKTNDQFETWWSDRDVKFTENMDKEEIKKHGQA